jgi:hypothetical protein
MKIIITCPVKNEEWILRETLTNFSSFADKIIIADQSSTDQTLNICKEFENVKVIHNHFKGYTNEVRFMLLDEARKEPGEKIIICLDADEQISPSAIEEMKLHIKNKKDTTTVNFYSEWLQFYGSNTRYRVDGVWRKNYKVFAFLDDPRIDYDREYITQEHIPRTPNTDYNFLLNTPIIHTQFLAKKRCQIKQALYMCNELLEGWDPRRTNNRYSITKYSNNLPLKEIDKKYLQSIHFPTENNKNLYEERKLEDIINLFKKKGSLFFESLDIWDIEELSNYFEAENGRKPFKVKKFPYLLILVNNMKNKLKYELKRRYNDFKI